MMSDEGDSVIGKPHTFDLMGQFEEHMKKRSTAFRADAECQPGTIDPSAYVSTSDTTQASDDKIISGGLGYKGPPNPKVSNVKRDSIDPRPVGCVRLSRWDMGGACPIHRSEDIPEHTEVLDCHTMTRMSVGRVASRYEFGANLTVSHNGQTWRVETWRERAMRYQRELEKEYVESYKGGARIR